MTESSVEQDPGNRVREWLLVLLFLSALLLVFTQLERQSQRSWPSDQVVVRLQGEHYQLSTAQWQQAREFSRQHFQAGEARMRQQLELEVRTRLEAVFAGVEARLPEFADWYYSPLAETSRLAWQLANAVNLSDRNYVADRAEQMLFPAAAWQAEMQEAQLFITASVTQQQQQQRAVWLEELSARLQPYSVPASLTAGMEADPQEALLALDGFLTRLDAGNQALETRLLTSSGAAMAVASQALWRAASTRIAARTGRAAAGRLAGRGAARAGTAAVGAGAVCAPSGPLAIGCAAIAGAATWLATDWLLLKIDEFANREQLLASMQAGLAALREGVIQQVLADFDALVAARYEAINADIQNDFVPMHTLQY